MSGPHVFLVAGEHSGDQLGFKLMAALKAARPSVRFSGVGGPRMEGEGLASLFPMEDVAVMGFTAVLPRLPTILRRIRETAEAAIAARPDVLVIIDSPDFTHRVARKVRAARPDIPIVDYVSPTVWAWRPGRAKAMRGYVDQLMALLPFEPAVHERLGGPPTTYVGHPLIERLAELRPQTAAEQAAREAEPPALLVMPGSRRVTLERLLPVFGETLRRLVAQGLAPRIVTPTPPRLEAQLRAGIAQWPLPVEIITGEAEKLAAFRTAHAALVCSGTASLELALAGVPMVVAYRVSTLESFFTGLIRVPSIVLPNLVLGENAIPEFLHHTATADQLAPAVADLLRDTPARRAQVAALARLDARMVLGTETPSERAARIVLAAARV